MNPRFSVFMEVAIAKRRRLEAQSLPTDCIRQFPTTNPETTELVGFDMSGNVRIRVEIPKDEDIDEWTAWLLRWVRRRDRRRLVRVI